MYKVIWDDWCGNRQELCFDNGRDAQTVVDSLEKNPFVIWCDIERGIKWNTEEERMKRIEKIKKIIDRHHVPYFEQNGRLFANSMEGGTELFEHAVDVTDMTKPELYAWLGY